MNKVIKGFVIGACVCIVVGIVFFIGAARAGGINTARSLVEDGGIVVGMTEDELMEWNTATEHTISLADMDTPSLELELGAGEFEIIESDVTDIVVKSKKKVNVETKGDTIYIHTPEHFVLFSSLNGNHNSIVIQIPKGMQFEDINIEVGAGELACPSLNAESLEMDLGAGRITVENYNCEKAVISVGAGEIIVANGSANEMDIDVGMGNFVFEGKVAGDLDVDCGMGNVQMKLYGSEKDYNYAVDCGMGNVTVGNHSYGGVATDQEIDNDAAYDCDLDCGMGNVEIRFTEE